MEEKELDLISAVGWFCVVTHLQEINDFIRTVRKNQTHNNCDILAVALNE